MSQFSLLIGLSLHVMIPRIANQVYLCCSAVAPPTILVTGPFTPQVLEFSPGEGA